MKKYSKYNVYQGCATMHSLTEAIKLVSELSTATGDPVGELAKIESKVSLYNNIFYGFGNTAEQEKEYQKIKKELLSSLSTDDEAFTELVVKETAKNTADAMAEYQERINSIDRRSKAGFEEGFEAYDEKKVGRKKQTIYNQTNFSELTNLSIGRAFRCNDDGVYIYDEKELDYVRVSDAVSIKSIPYDMGKGTKYIELEYYDYIPVKKVKSLFIPAEELVSGKYNLLVSKGVVIDNVKLFTKYLNDLRSIDHKTKQIKHCRANMYYGYPRNEDGTIDYSVFIGCDEENQIIPLDEFYEFDKAMFHSKGTVDGFKNFLSVVSKGKYTIDFQMIVSASLSCITQAIINQGMNVIAPQSYIFIGHTTIGKNLLSAIANNVWAAPFEANLICASDSTLPYLNSVRYRQMYLPTIIADLQDLIDEAGVKAVSELVFNHSNGKAGGRSTVTGGAREMKYWLGQLIAFTESDVFTSNLSLGGGADARHIILNLNVSLADKFITEKPPITYMGIENENYAVLGKAFVEAMKSKSHSDVMKRFNEIQAEMEAFGVQNKQTNALAMLCLTDELGKEFGLLPDEWEVLSAERLINWVGVKEVKDLDFEAYKMLSEQVFKDRSYVPIDSDIFNTTDPFRKVSVDQIFASRMKTDSEIRGRIVWEKQDKESGKWVQCKKCERERSVLVIPNIQLKQLISHIKEISGMDIYHWSKSKWAENGWLIKNGKEYTFKDKYKIDITRPRDSLNRETHYSIVLYEERDVIPEYNVFD